MPPAAALAVIAVAQAADHTAIYTALIGVGGTIAGSVLGFLGARLGDHRVWRRNEALQCRLYLADIKPLIWAPNSWPIFESQLDRLGVHLAVLHITKEMIVCFREAAIGCWRDSSADYERNGAPEGGAISTDLMEKFDGAVVAIDRRLAKIR